MILWLVRVAESFPLDFPWLHPWAIPLKTLSTPPLKQKITPLRLISSLTVAHTLSPLRVGQTLHSIRLGADNQQ